jgi:signal transduction histidine kinase
VSFTELVATAIANAESQSELAASRRRIVEASDDARRRIERDLHDGIQQQLVSLGMELGELEASLPGDGELKPKVAGVAGGLRSAVDDLREISRGIHPAILSHGGLGAALRTLARRSAVPVQLNAVVDGRLPERVEVAAYYVVSEALTNAARHARASVVSIEVVGQERALELSIRDDGVGGADPGGGTGLIGLKDRIEALGGTITVESPHGQGTSLVVTLPLGGEAGSATDD